MTSDDRGPVWLTTDLNALRLVREIVTYDGVVLLAVVTRDGHGPAVLVASDEDEVSVSYVMADIDDEEVGHLSGLWDPGQLRAMILGSARVARIRRHWTPQGAEVVTETDVNPADLSPDELPGPAR